ncbi:helix-hairpin-helix domain-containing protein [Brachybacterium massiliense]|uniref:helix-hairpin-helix domain-containing protein n=1 Tax=Brachybacterium massiliense TaxID=1755098 RepID=UPI000B3BBF1D|nr:ComEA family DNA-binding protein [Brachybacterium massiliense]
MGAQGGTGGRRRGRTGRHRRTGQPLIERRDHSGQSPARRFSVPAPSPSALVGIAVLVLIAVGAIHLSGSGTAVPPEPETAVEAPPQKAPGDDAGEPSPAEEAPSAAAQDASEPPAPQQLVVHVSGAVDEPGVVSLPPGSRVDDALEAAGGPGGEADLSAINLARPLEDGEHIHVPVPGEEPPASAAETGGGSPAGSGSTGSQGQIDLNTASAAELEELPGVGPAIAQRILEHREKNGPFTSVDGLLEVSGIGPATLEKIRERATV